MNCLRINQIYLFLEKELSPSENKKIEEHLASCPKCKKAMEEREFLHQAAESLPLWQTPPDFTHQIMAAIFPEKISLRSWFTALAAGFSSTVLILSAYFLISGQNVVDLAVKFNSMILNFVKNSSVLLAKLLKLILLFAKMTVQFAEFLFKGFNRLTSIISPEILITLIILTLFLSAFLLYGVSRKLLIGEKT